MEVLVDLKNTGNYDGEEVVQVYVRDEWASVGRYDRMLKAFQRVALKKGETRQIRLTLPSEAFELYDQSLQRVVEPGLFTVYVGSSSRLEDLKAVSLNIR